MRVCSAGTPLIFPCGRGQDRDTDLAPQVVHEVEVAPHVMRLADVPFKPAFDPAVECSCIDAADEALPSCVLVGGPLVGQMVVGNTAACPATNKMPMSNWNMIAPEQ